MSKTPRTDAVHNRINDSRASHADDIITATDFARELEQESDRFFGLLERARTELQHGGNDADRAKLIEEIGVAFAAPRAS